VHIIGLPATPCLRNRSPANRRSRSRLSTANEMRMYRGLFCLVYCIIYGKVNLLAPGALHLTLRLLMSYIYGAPILDVSRSHTTTQHSR